MRSWKLGLLGVGALALASVGRAEGDDGAARAQVSVKVGAFFPGDGGMRAQAASAWWYAGVDIQPVLSRKPANGALHLGADLSMRTAGGKTVFIMPLLAKVTWDLTPPDEPSRLYGGLGPGIYMMNTRYSGLIRKPGLQFVAGADLSERVYAEVTYDWVSAFYDGQDNPLRADGLKVAVGVRF